MAGSAATRSDADAGRSYDVVRTRCLVIGSGAAGLWAALHAAQDGPVLVITKQLVTESSTNYAQGGIATAAGHGDSPQLHARDTLAAGAGLCDEPAVEVLTTEGPLRVAELIRYGAHFDMVNGELHCHREAAHTRSRVIHAMGDATGAEVQRALTVAVKGERAVEVLEFTQALRLLVLDGQVVGADALNTESGDRVRIVADATIVATGGVGGLFVVTTNPPVATGDGMALAFRAGALLQDMEFVQFHPTALACDETPAPLITEAVRGEGGLLLNTKGERFMPAYHPEAELAPRDVVSRAEFTEMERLGVDRCYLDLSPIPIERLETDFPHILHMIRDHGIKAPEEPAPVRPAAHYAMGGVATDLGARSGVARLFAAGECASTGVHGANRLASNSLLEGLVFGYRAAASAAHDTPLDDAALAAAAEIPAVPVPAADPAVAQKVRDLMWHYVGIVRSAEGLAAAAAELRGMGDKAEAAADPWADPEAARTANMIEVSWVSACCAGTREESRGAHYRSDMPEPRDEWLCHLAVRRRAADDLEFQRLPVARRDTADE